MFSVKQKRRISDEVQATLRATQNPELPEGEIKFLLLVNGNSFMSWAEIRNNGAVDKPSVNLHNEIQARMAIMGKLSCGSGRAICRKRTK